MDTRVLIVEDDPSLRTLVMRSLQENGFLVHPAGSAAEAWAVIEVEPIDLIILDIMLPGANGLDLCREIRQHGTFRLYS